jgi:hypothetical protein
MPVTPQSTQVTADTFNELVTQTINFWGVELGQICRPLTRFVGTDEIVTNERWNDLINDVIDARHFTLRGTNTRAEVAGLIPSPWNGTALPNNQVITADVYNTVEQMIEDAQVAVNPGYANLGTDNFSFTVPDDTNVGFSGSVTIGFPGGYTYTSNANGDTRVASNTDHARHWTNAGGRILTDITYANVPDDDKNQDYASMADLISANPPNWSPLEGNSDWRSLASEQSAYNTYATATYADNFMDLRARKINDYTGEVQMRLTDGSGGDPDEIVTADFTTNNRVYYPSFLGNDLKPTVGEPNVVSQGITDYYVDISLPRTGSQSGTSGLFNDPVNTDTNTIGEYNVPLGTYNVTVTGSVGVDGTRDGFFGLDKDPAGDVYLIIRTLSYTGPDLQKVLLIPGKSTSARTKTVNWSFTATGYAVHYALIQWSYNGDGPHWVEAKLRFQLDPV